MLQIRNATPSALIIMKGIQSSFEIISEQVFSWSFELRPKMVDGIAKVNAQSQAKIISLPVFLGEIFFFPEFLMT